MLHYLQNLDGFYFPNTVARLFFVCVCGGGGGGGGVKLVKFWDLLWLRVDYLAIALDLERGVRWPPWPPPLPRLWAWACNPTDHSTSKNFSAILCLCSVPNRTCAGSGPKKIKDSPTSQAVLKILVSHWFRTRKIGNCLSLQACP